MGQFGAGIKTIQQGSETLTSAGGAPEDTTANVTVTAVVLAKSIVLVTCSGGGEHTYAGQAGSVSAQLTTTTNLQLKWTNLNANARTTVVGWQVIEFY